MKALRRRHGRAKSPRPEGQGGWRQWIMEHPWMTYFLAEDVTSTAGDVIESVAQDATGR